MIRTIVIWVSQIMFVCLFVCLFVWMSSPLPYHNISRNFFYVTDQDVVMEEVVDIIPTLIPCTGHVSVVRASPVFISFESTCRSSCLVFRKQYFC